MKKEIIFGEFEIQINSRRSHGRHTVKNKSKAKLWGHNYSSAATKNSVCLFTG